MNEISTRWLRCFRWVIPPVGIGFILLLECVRTGDGPGNDFSPSGVLVLLYLASAYFVLSILTFWIRNERLLLAPVALVVAEQLHVEWVVSTSKSSTAALAFFFTPPYQFAAIVVGLIVGWCLLRVGPNQRRGVDARGLG